MKFVIAAFALAVASPAAAQPAAQTADHSQHREHGQADHARHGQQGHGEPGQHREGQRHDCPCCQPGPDGQRPACCERMNQQQGQQSR
ncbi:MAG TPA: hypothetical protein VEW25_06215 [Allosphingosinicella sp.]|nr:hypothetical protein [Allosphingosinicella sp.]